MRTSRVTRFATALGGGVALAALLLGCVPEAPPTAPAPTPLFASEEEAFAAAEEVYRAYTAATSMFASGDENADPIRFTAGTAYEAELEFWRLYEQSTWRLVGESVVGRFDGVDADINSPVPRVVAEVCLNSTEVRVIDDSGSDITPEGREDVSMLTVTFFFDGGRFVISESIHDGPGEC